MRTMRSNGARSLVLLPLALLFCLDLAPLGAQSAARTPVRLEVADGSTAQYRVNEQLARLTLPNDAVGTTGDISGALVLQGDGTFGADSKLTVDLRTLKSDAERRDAYLRRNTLETDEHPLAEFVPRRQKGLTLPLPASGTAKFQLIGDMRLHGVTAEVVWDVTADFSPEAVSARATTRFPFGKFNLTIPRMLALISVQDDIRLELDVRLRRSAPPNNSTQ